MRKIVLTSLSLLILTVALTGNIEAQNMRVTKNAKSGKKETKKFSDRLWYGGSLILNYYGQSNYKVFTFGVTPMVGIKLFDEFSIGPRVGVRLDNYRLNTGSKIDKLPLFEFSEGVFARYKFLKVVFAHAEFNFTQYQYVSPYLSPTGELQKVNANTQNAYLGLGYNGGMGQLGTEIYVLYNFLEEQNSVAQPFDIRFGITYKF